MIFDAFVISAKMTLTSIAACSIVGILLANYMCRKRTRLVNVLENMLLLPMFLPPSIIGYGLLLLLSRNSVFGGFLDKSFGISLIFTWQAGAIATFIMALPIIYQNSKAAFLSISPECEDAGRVDGASHLQVFFKIKLPMALRSILCGIILGFARAFGEFGATLMVAGNIPGRTQNIPTSIYYAVDSGDSGTANELFVVVLIIGILFITLFNRLIKVTDY